MNNYDQFKTPEKRAALLKEYYSPELDRSEEEFWLNMPEIMWELPIPLFVKPNEKDIEWARKKLIELGYDKEVKNE